MQVVKFAGVREAFYELRRAKFFRGLLRCMRPVEVQYLECAFKTGLPTVKL